MRFLHLSDLHLGKRVNEFPMLEDQAYILKENTEHYAMSRRWKRF